MTYIDQLKKFEQDLDIKIIHAVQTGSVMWGYNKPDSDKDIRFLFMHNNPKKYLNLTGKTEHINVIEDNIDYVGYDLTKFYKLLTKSNFACYELVKSPFFVYGQGGETIGKIKQLAFDTLSIHKLAYQSYGMIHGIVKNKILDNIDLKDLIVAAREALLIEWYYDNIKADTNELPPLFIQDLIIRQHGVSKIAFSIHDLIDYRQGNRNLSPERYQNCINKVYKYIMNVYNNFSNDKINPNGGKNSTALINDHYTSIISEYISDVQFKGDFL